MSATATRSSSPGLPYPVDEYQGRWQRLYAELEARGYEAAVIWQRSGGGYDRAGDLHWLCNYASLSSGQEPAYLGPVGKAFAALIFLRGREPQLHICEPAAMIDREQVATADVIDHENLPEGVGRALREAGVSGPVLYNGEDFLPVPYMKALEAAAPDVEWTPCLDLIWAIHKIKSPLELDVLRETGAVATRSLTALMEDLIAGKPETEAAARAAQEIIRAGGGIQRIATAFGPKSESVMWSTGMYGYGSQSPAPGDMVRGWIYGPLCKGMWLDPGRAAVCGNKPTAEQRKLLESAVDIIEQMAGAIRPGVHSQEVGALGDRLMEQAGNELDEDLWDLYGHGVGKDFFLDPVIPRLGAMPQYTGTYEAGMAVTVEMFLLHKGVGWGTFEHTGLVGENGWEPLDRTPLLFW
jgi:Xaa-Pro aminopeptidase